MKKLFWLLLFPVSSFAQITDANLNLEADTIRTETHAGRNTAQRVGRMFKNIIANKSNINGGTGILAISGGGTGTASPGLVAGSNISITGSWPNQTINQSGGAGISNSAANLELMMSDGVNATPSSLFQGSNVGDLNLGKSATTGSTRTVKSLGNGGGQVDIELLAQSSSGKVVVENTGSQAVLQVGSSGTFTRYSTAGISTTGSSTFVLNGVTYVNVGTVSITSGSLQTLYTIPTTSGKSMYVKVKMVGRWTSGAGSTGDSSFQGYTVGVKNISGTPTVFTSNHDYGQTSATDSPTSIVFTVAGSNILVQTQTNTSGSTYNCTTYVEFFEAN